MSKQVYCVKLKAEAEALDSPPFPGALGEKLLNSVSKPGWKLWLNHQTMLINEYRLNLADPKSSTFLMEEMNQFFFGPGSEKPTGFSPEK